MSQTAAWYEEQYNPRLTVPDVPKLIEAWRIQSVLVRNRLLPLTDFKYGSHPRENLDLFRVRNAAATLVFIHGGYWRSHSKLETSFIAEHFVAQGISVALINYPLCPDVELGDIRRSVLRAFEYLWKKVLTEAERQAVVISGHSAGGHLAALHATKNWAARGIVANPIKAIVSLSGVFDVRPLLHTSMNADLRLTEDDAADLNLLDAAPIVTPRILLTVGSAEPEAFHAQSQDLAKAWSVLSPEYRAVEDTNHFTIVDAFANPATALHQDVIKLFAA
jgi:arylformamidase